MQSTLSHEVASLSAGGMRVDFSRAGDRYAHAIYLVDGDAEICVLESVEGDSSDVWPPSPPLQALEFEKWTDGGRLALLVGMAGRNHWSVSAELDPQLDQVVCDVACRLQEDPSEPGNLRSSYRVHGTMELDASNHLVLVHVPEGGCELRVEPVEAAPVDFAIAGDHLVLSPRPEGNGLPRTARWKYVIRRVR
ncbi:MAG: hypothetical protein R3C10_02920 [Pirellulales bacterium]